VRLGGVGLTIETGMRLGRTETPGPSWQRLLWAELFERLELPPGGREYPPCFRWFPYTSWPIRISPPALGSLDRLSYERLVELLALESGDMNLECYCYYSPLACGSKYDLDRSLVVKCALSELRGLYDFEDVDDSPSEIWPADRSWFVWTDHDLNGTRVRGSRSLIDSIIADPVMETTSWHHPHSAT
jgi:hypothetical protein